MTKKHYIFILILISWLFGLGLGSYLGEKHAKTETETIYLDKIVIEKDTLLITDTVQMPIPARVDTVQVLREFHTKRIIRDTVINNDTVLIVIRDTVYQNKIINRRVDYQNLMPVPVIFKTANTFSAGLNLNTINGFGYGPAINYNHQKLTCGLTADLKNKIILGTITIKIFSNQQSTINN
ncbi:MAG: hypothetical protein PF448_08755 [Bacteroidales bacterium]|jgi:hypothetical protein|nr:hypothetical protein [Bacteroidales bacterium]